LVALLEQDGAEPCGNSIAVGNLERLAIAVDRSDYHDKAGRTLCLFQERLAKIPVTLPEMVAALQLYEQSPTEVGNPFPFFFFFLFLVCLAIQQSKKLKHTKNK
jgi:hypothetical protein